MINEKEQRELRRGFLKVPEKLGRPMTAIVMSAGMVLSACAPDIERIIVLPESTPISDPASIPEVSPKVSGRQAELNKKRAARRAFVDSAEGPDENLTDLMNIPLEMGKEHITGLMERVEPTPQHIQFVNELLTGLVRQTDRRVEIDGWYSYNNIEGKRVIVDRGRSSNLGRNIEVNVVYDAKERPDATWIALYDPLLASSTQQGLRERAEHFFNIPTGSVWRPTKVASESGNPATRSIAVTTASRLPDGSREFTLVAGELGRTDIVVR